MWGRMSLFKKEESIARLPVQKSKSNWGRGWAAYFCVYSALFAVVAFGVYYFFYQESKSFIWKPDGLEQHYNSLIYFGQYLRGIAANFFEIGRLVIPQWDFNIGYGADIITTLQYYVIGDPLNLLSIFVKPEQTEYLYNALILTRIFLSGLAFSAYCAYRGSGRFSALSGAFCYMFCGFALYAGVRHPYFINPMIYFPFILMGIDKIFKKEKPYVYIFSVFAAALCGFYFFYMACILMVLYAAIQFFLVYKENRGQHFLKCLVQFGGYSIVAVLMACAIFLPTVIKLFETNRSEISRYLSLLYEPYHYMALFGDFLSTKRSEHWVVLQYTPLVLLAICLLFFHRKGHRSTFRYLLILTICLLFPIFGYVLHGFSYVSNRWVWAYSFVLSYTLTLMIPHFSKIYKKQAVSLVSVCLFYVLICSTRLKLKNSSALAAIIVLFLSVGFLLIASRYFKSHQGKKRIFQFGILTFVIIGILIQSTYLTSPKYNDYVKRFVENGEAYQQLTKLPKEVKNQIKDTEFYRLDDNLLTTSNAHYNAGITQGISCTNYYFSLGSCEVGNFIREMNLDYTTDYYFYGLESRTIPGILSNVGYFTLKKGSESYLPYGYKNALNSEENNQIKVYKNQNSLPFGYTYSSAISRDEYETLPAYKKQQAMLQGAVIEKVPQNLIKASPKYTEQALTYYVECEKGIAFENGKITVTDKNAHMYLTFSGIAESETYLSIQKLNFTPQNVLESSNISNIKWLFQPKGYETKIEASSNENSARLRYRTPEHKWYSKKHDFLMNLCYKEEPRNKITLTFSANGEYTFEKLEIICQPMADIPNQANELKQDALQNVKFEPNTVSGNITLTKPKLLCLPISSIKGWSATVNGEEMPLEQVNTMMCGLVLEEGSHEIILNYHMPYGRLGLLCTGAGFIMLFGILFYQSILKKKQNKN